VPRSSRLIPADPGRPQPDSDRPRAHCLARKIARQRTPLYRHGREGSNLAVALSRGAAGSVCVMLTDMDVEELQRALGGVVLESAYLERVLRAAFSALVGSKYAAVIDGRMTAHGLIEDCQHIVREHTDIVEAAKAQLTEALNACAVANTGRNRVIHDAWAYRPGT
jgi:hypothetical protein